MSADRAAILHLLQTQVDQFAGLAAHAAAAAAGGDPLLVARQTAAARDLEVAQRMLAAAKRRYTAADERARKDALFEGLVAEAEKRRKR